MEEQNKLRVIGKNCLLVLACATIAAAIIGISVAAVELLDPLWGSVAFLGIVLVGLVGFLSWLDLRKRKF